MGLPKKSNIKKHIPLTESKTLLPRRYELLDKINKDGTYLPKSLLHADLDGGFLNFVKTDLQTIVDGKKIPHDDGRRKGDFSGNRNTNGGKHHCGRSSVCIHQLNRSIGWHIYRICTGWRADIFYKKHALKNARF